MGAEFRGTGANVQLGPGLNLARVPRNGRNFEYLAGEDPYLGYVLAKREVQGIQAHKVIACGKHWVGNSQEANRMDVSEDVDERTLFEMYYPPFEGAVQGGVGSIMCSYNRLNGTYSCENPVTLGHLKNELGFKGFVMSDWGATHTASMHQGLDMEMPVGMNTNTLALLMKGVAPEDIDNSVRRTLRMMYEIGVMDEPLSAWDKALFKKNVSTPEHIQLARRLSADSTVLLKNEDDVLPLPQGSKLALIGLASENGRAVSFGHGSGEVPPSYYVSPLAGIREQADADAQVRYDSGKDIDAAVELAKDSDYAIVFVGGSASEGADRQNLSLDGACKVKSLDGKTVPCEANDDEQNRLVASVAKANKRTIVVASVPGAFLLPWVHDVQAALVNFMPGQQAGNAIADILFGKRNPCAKLPITLPNKENEVGFEAGQYPGVRRDDKLTHSVYSERLLVGYRYYDAHGIAFDTGFPFGHGLSYTSFEYSSLDVNAGKRTVSFVVRNAGSVPGREVAQLYLSFPPSAGEPLYQLKGFKKTALLEAGASEAVQFVLSERDISIWSVEEHRWTPVRTGLGLRVGSSSRDIRLQRADVDL
mmetsp:Transcript_57050/g.177032  ORF Transcript_57050/g.177032 Transcript_57050/m.177032 type:complete len:591 (-) Transcript_57050:39-1811(-)